MWVITGDKQETAINIAIACKLIRRPDSLLLCNASSKEEVHERLQQLKQQLSREYGHVGGPPKPTPFSGESPAHHCTACLCSDVLTMSAPIQMSVAFMTHRSI